MSRVVAVIGASSDRSRYANKAVRAYLAEGYRVIPVHPTETHVEGLPVYRRVGDIPGTVDLVTVYVPPAVTLALLPELVAKGVTEVWLNPGSEDAAVLAEARRLQLSVTAACSIVGLGRSPNQF